MRASYLILASCGALCILGVVEYKTRATTASSDYYSYVSPRPVGGEPLIADSLEYEHIVRGARDAFVAPQARFDEGSGAIDSPSQLRSTEIIMDPNAPESWVDDFNPDVSDAGVSMDPNDSETWLDDFTPSDSDAGVTMDPNDPGTWVESKRYDIDDGGVLLDPNDPSTWEQLGGEKRLFDSGPVMDPNLPDSW